MAVGRNLAGFHGRALPMASQPSAMAGRNWMMRRMLIDAIRNDPEWNDGNYTKQPAGFQRARVYFGLATSGGTEALYRAAPTREKADALIAHASRNLKPTMPMTFFMLSRLHAITTQGHVWKRSPHRCWP